MGGHVHDDAPAPSEETHDVLVIEVPISKALVRDVNDWSEVGKVAKLASELASSAAERAVNRLRREYETEAAK